MIYIGSDILSSTFDLTKLLQRRSSVELAILTPPFLGGNFNF
jgi:hypothetical protein